jgi:hypothetical protein
MKTFFTAAAIALVTGIFVIVTGAGLSTAGQVEIRDVTSDYVVTTSATAQHNVTDINDQEISGVDDESNWRLISYVVYRGTKKGGPTMDSFDVGSLSICQMVGEHIMSKLEIYKRASSAFCVDTQTGEIVDID